MANNFYDTVFDVDKLMQNYSSKNLEEILRYFVKPGIKLYFFRKLGGFIDENYDPNPWLRPLMNKGYFSPSNNPPTYQIDEKTRSTPLWLVLPFLRNIAKKNAFVINPNVDLLLEIVNKIINYKDDQGNFIDNSTTDYYLVTIIGYLNEDLITENHFKFIETKLRFSYNSDLISGEIKDNLLPNYFKSGKRSKFLVLNLLEIMFDYKKRDHRYEPIMGTYWLVESLKIFQKKIFLLCGFDGCYKAILKIREIVKNDKYAFSTISAIEDHPQNMFTDDYEFQLTHFIRDFCVSDIHKVDNIKPLIEELLFSDINILKRIAIHSINHYYPDMKDLFWDWDINPLEITELKHEIYELLKSRNNLFDENECEKVIKWIKTADYNIEKDNKHKNEIILYEKSVWASAFENSSQKILLQFYQVCMEKNKSEIEHPGFDIYVESLRPPNYSIEMCNKSNEEIVSLIEEYERNVEKNDSLFLEGSASGFLKKCIDDDPEKFSSELEPFIDVSLRNQFTLLYGLLEASRNKVHFEWGELIGFISKIISTKQFLKENEQAYKYELIKVISDLIEEKTKNDDNAFEKEQLNDICKILFVLFENDDSVFKREQDLITAVINSSKGRLLSSFINFSLSYARLYRINYKDKWLPQLKELFEKIIENPYPEFSVTIGRYLPQLFYLDAKWCEENIRHIFSTESFEDTFIGYIAYPNRIYETIYKILKANDIYEDAINCTFNDVNANSNIVNHICTAFLFNMERLDDHDSLIYKLINNKKSNQLSTIINYFLIQKDKHKDKITPKMIKDLGKMIFEIASEEPEEYRAVLSDLSRWAVFFKEPDEELLHWLLFSAKYMDQHARMKIIESLLNFADKSPKKVCDIYVETIRDIEYPDQRTEDIRKLIATLYKNHENMCADRICNIYGEKGHYFLKECYEKYHEYG